MAGPRIGELNGRWAMLLKLTLIAVPVLTTLITAAFLPWAVWVTSNIYASQQTVEIVRQLSVDVHEIEVKVQNLPSAEWKDRIVKLEEASFDNREDHAEIKITLAEIKAVLKPDRVDPKPN